MTPPEATDLSRLAGDWWIFQLRRGHRYNTDDVLTAWTAAAARPDARRILDLGAGVGSVGLLTLLLLPAAQLVSVEVQEVSAGLLRRTVIHNRLEDRVVVHRADLRDSEALAGVGTFELICANPPYLPRGSAVASPHPQRAAARMELHGDVFDYCRVAARHLAPRGRLCLCHAASDRRPERAAHEAGLRVLSRRDVVFREGSPPRLALYVCGFEGSVLHPEPLRVRDAQGSFTEAYMQVRREMLIAE